MPNLIQIAKQAMEAMGVEKALVIGFTSDDQLLSASYGKTKQDCTVSGLWLNAVMDALESGEVTIDVIKRNQEERTLAQVVMEIGDETFQPGKTLSIKEARLLNTAILMAKAERK